MAFVAASSINFSDIFPDNNIFSASLALTAVLFTAVNPILAS